MNFLANSTLYIYVHISTYMSPSLLVTSRLQVHCVQWRKQREVDKCHWSTVWVHIMMFSFYSAHKVTRPKCLFMGCFLPQPRRLRKSILRVVYTVSHKSQVILQILFSLKWLYVLPIWSLPSANWVSYSCQPMEDSLQNCRVLEVFTSPVAGWRVYILYVRMIGEALLSLAHWTLLAIRFEVFC